MAIAPTETPATAMDATSQVTVVEGQPPSKLPAIPEDITAEWLSSVLSLKIQSVNITKTATGTASKVFIAITYDDTSSSSNHPTNLCIKGGFDPTFIQTMPWLIKIYQRECDFYNDIAPSLTTMQLPRCWWAGHTPTQGIVILDDLAAQGSIFGNPASTWNFESVLSGVEQLAALHAKTWHIQASDYPWLTSDYDDAILALMQTYDAVVHAPDRPVIPAYLKDQTRMTAVLKTHFARRNPRFQCLLHGDAHTGNTYLVDGSPRFLDWQMIHVGSAFHDVAYFVGAALSVEERRAREWDVVEWYLRALERGGVEKMSVLDEEVRTEYRKAFLAGVGWIMCPFEMQSRDCVGPMAVRYAAALDDHGVLELVEGLGG